MPLEATSRRSLLAYLATSSVVDPGRPQVSSKGPAVLVGIGQSQLVAVEKAYEASPPPKDTQFRFIQMREGRYMPSLERETGALNSSLAAAIQQTLAVQAPAHVPLVFLAVGGAQYANIGMVNEPTAFDFVLPEAPDLPSTGAEMLPIAEVEATMRRQTALAFAIIDRLRQQTDKPMYQLSAPPPVPDNEYLVNRGGAFAEKIRQYGITNPMLRYKLWRLQCRLYTEACEKLGITFLPVPPIALDENGFLKKLFWGDGIHSNPRYGRIVMSHLEAISARQHARAMPQPDQPSLPRQPVFAPPQEPPERDLVDIVCDEEVLDRFAPG